MYLFVKAPLVCKKFSLDNCYLISIMFEKQSYCINKSLRKKCNGNGDDKQEDRKLQFIREAWFNEFKKEHNHHSKYFVLVVGFTSYFFLASEMVNLSRCIHAAVFSKVLKCIILSNITCNLLL